MNKTAERSVVTELLADVKLPEMARARQIFDRPVIEDLRAEVRAELSKDEISSCIKPGMRIAITSGSRGVANIALVTREIVGFLKEKGAVPFIIPTMGSHGGATAEGQRRIIEEYGVTEEYCGCEILSSMEVKHIGCTDEGHKVLIDKYAAESDGIIVLGRIKAHTEFRGPYESGLMKMITIGLGKQQGAEVCHEAGFKHMGKLVPLFANAILEQAPILFGVGLIENAYDETCVVKALTPAQIREEEPALLIRAKELMAKIWIEDVDVLIVDKIGKDISGNGADPNITGKFSTPWAAGGIDAQRSVVLDLTDATHGNATGVGVFDSTTRRLFDKMSFEATYPNAITSTVLLVGHIPLVLENDRDAIAIALKSCNETDKENPRVIRIRDTMHLDEILISKALIEEAREHPNMEVIGEPMGFPFDPEGNLW